MKSVLLSEDDDTDNDQEMNSFNETTDTTSFDAHAFESNVKKCRDHLSQNPNDYTAHLNVVTALSNIQYMNPFRKARDKMSRKFAIPPSVSIDFINVEIEYLYYLSQDTAPTIQDISAVIQLFDKAIADYSVDLKLWTNYLQFVFQFESVLGIEAIRNNILTNAIRTIGQHFYDGHHFWSLYREFETQYLAALVTKQSKDDTPDIVDIDGMQSEDEEDADEDAANYSVSKQTEHLRHIWRQQIQIPHFQIEDTYRSYQDWESALYGKTSAEYKPKYNASKKLSKHFKKWEPKLQELEANVSPGYASAERLKLWQEYIADIGYKIKNIKPKTMQSLYERAVMDCFLHETIWKEYIEWIKASDLKFEIVSVCARSIRNIPLSVHLWSEYIYAVQWTELDIEEVNQRIFARFVFPMESSTDDGALQRRYKVKKDEIIDFGNDVDKYIFMAIAKCEYYRMRAHCAFDERYEEDMKDDTKEDRMKEAERTFDEMAAWMEQHVMRSWSLTFYKFYIDFVSRFVGNIEKARGLWEKLMKARGKEWNLWTDFIEWESTFGETQPVMPSKRKKQQQQQQQQVTSPMRKFGQNNIYRIRHLYHRAIFILDLESGVQYIGDRLIEFERKCGDLESLKNAKIRLQKKLKEQRKRQQRNEAKRLKTKKRKRSDYDEEDKRMRDDTNDTNTTHDHHRKKEDYINARRRQTDPNYVDIDTKGTKEERTVFVVNFRPTMKRKEVQRIFEKFGKLESVRLPNNTKEKHKHKLRGIGWIEYKHKENAVKCIKELNGTSVQGRILRVERYRDKSNHENTVYIKGLPKETESDARECIQTVLAECGEIREIRLMKEKYDARATNKRVKGFGYVEFVKHESVAMALKCDKSIYKEAVIEVLPYVEEDKREKQYHHKEREKVKDNNEMDVDEAVQNVSSQLVDKLGFVPRSISGRKSQLGRHSNTNKSVDTKTTQFDKKILNKSNKSQDDFRKLFNI